MDTVNISAKFELRSLAVPEIIGGVPFGALWHFI